MLNYLEGYKGKVTVNGVEYDNINAVKSALKTFNGTLTIGLNQNAFKALNMTSTTRTAVTATQNNPITDTDTKYLIKVRQYMIKPSSFEFDFHKKWNNDIPMPMRIMVGRKLQETRGMVKMELWGDIIQEQTSHCMKCGRVLTNPVSKYFGIGPECGSHGYVNPFETDEELKEAVKAMKEQLNNIRWTGWIIKSAIEQETAL